MKKRSFRLPPTPAALEILEGLAKEDERGRLRKIARELASIARDALTPAEEQIAQICIEAGVAEWHTKRGGVSREFIFLRVRDKK